MKCALRDCERRYFARGYCQMHYARMRRYGDPLLVRFPIDLTVEDRFWPKVEKTNDCWIWIASGGRYGHFKYNGRIEMAHRVSWLLEYGEIPDGLDVLHRCDRPRCVRPDHLFLGTHADNMRDMRAKGRGNSPIVKFNRGSQNFRSRATTGLTEDQVREIRAMAGMSRAEIARRYSTSWGCIDSILKRKTWTHI